MICYLKYKWLPRPAPMSQLCWPLIILKSLAAPEHTSCWRNTELHQADISYICSTSLKRECCSSGITCTTVCNFCSSGRTSQKGFVCFLSSLSGLYSVVNFNVPLTCAFRVRLRPVTTYVENQMERINYEMFAKELNARQDTIFLPA